MNITRRNLAFAIPGLGLVAAGCTAQQVQQVVTDIQTIGSAALAEQAPISAITGLSAAKLTQIGSYIMALESAAASVAGAVTAGGSTVQIVIGAVNGIEAALASVVNIPASVSTFMVAAETLLPVMAAAVGLSLATAKPTGMSAAKARASLAALTTK